MDIQTHTNYETRARNVRPKLEAAWLNICRNAAVSSPLLAAFRQLFGI